MPHSPDVPCASCGTLMWRGTGSLPAGAATCIPCRKRARPHTCLDCGTPTQGTRCRPCYSLTRTIWGPHTQQARRNARERVAGLSRERRRKLLHQWQAQGRPCTFCPGRCETVDHVIPLARGGTNYEGNLTPACVACNSSRGARLLMEWPVFFARVPQSTPPSSFPPRESADA